MLVLMFIATGKVWVS